MPPYDFAALRQFASTKSKHPARRQQIERLNMTLAPLLKGRKNQRSKRLTLLSLVFGRPLTTTNELSRGEIYAFQHAFHNPATGDRFTEALKEQLAALDQSQ